MLSGYSVGSYRARPVCNCGLCRTTSSATRCRIEQRPLRSSLSSATSSASHAEPTSFDGSLDPFINWSTSQIPTSHCALRRLLPPSSSVATPGQNWINQYPYYVLLTCAHQSAFHTQNPVFPTTTRLLKRPQALKLPVFSGQNKRGGALSKRPNLPTL